MVSRNADNLLTSLMFMLCGCGAAESPVPGTEAEPSAQAGSAQEAPSEVPAARPADLAWADSASGLQYAAWVDAGEGQICCAVRNPTEEPIYCVVARTLGSDTMFRLHARPEGSTEWTQLVYRSGTMFPTYISCIVGGPLAPGAELEGSWMSSDCSGGLLQESSEHASFRVPLWRHEFPKTWTGEIDLRVQSFECEFPVVRVSMETIREKREEWMEGVRRSDR